MNSSRGEIRLLLLTFSNSLMKYNGIGFNAAHIASLSLESWVKISAKEFGFTEDQAKESHEMACLQEGVTPKEPKKTGKK